MLAVVLSMQSFGQLFAALVAFLALRGGLALDSTWRSVYELGAVPAAVALVYRSIIPESPRYRFNVAQNPNLADFDSTYALLGRAQAEEQRNLQVLLSGERGFEQRHSQARAREHP